MSFASDDLVPLLAAAGQESNAGLVFGQGVIKSWDRLTGQNTVEYRGALLKNLPILGTLESLLLESGDVVGILGFRTTYFVAGRITPPNSTGYGDALEAIRGFDAEALGTVSTQSTSFVSLTDGPIVEDIFVGPSGRLQVTLSGWLIVQTTGAAVSGAYMGFELRKSGDVVLAPAFSRSLIFDMDLPTTAPTGGAGSVTASRLVLLKGLTPGGGYTIEAKYRCATASQPAAQFSNRVISALAL